MNLPKTHNHNYYVISVLLLVFSLFSLFSLFCVLFVVVVSVFFIIIWVSVPYFTFHTNRIHSVSIRHRTNFHRNKNNNTSSTHTSKRNITIHLTDIHQIWCTHTDTALTDTDTDTRERFHSVFFLVCAAAAVAFVVVQRAVASFFPPSHTECSLWLRKTFISIAY